MKIGLYGLNRGSSTEPGVLRRRALLAEEAGFESLWIGDHIALPAGMGASPATDPAYEPRFEVLVTLSFLAAVTSRVQLAAGVVVLPQRQPVLLAKQLTTMDWLSDGRLIVGVGAGYVEAELAAFDVSLAERDARSDECLAALRALWNQPVSSFTGRFVSFVDVLQRPRPVQRPYPAIVVGGHSQAALRRAVEHGNGWYGWELDVEQSAQALTRLHGAQQRYERPSELGALEITITPPELPDLETVRAYAELGVHRIVVRPLNTRDSEIEELIAAVGETLVGGV